MATPQTIGQFLSSFDPNVQKLNVDVFGNPQEYIIPEYKDPYQELYSAVADGSVSPGNDFNQLMTNNEHGVSSSEFAALSPEVQAWARSHPQQFMQQVLARRNKANGDLLSIGAEGGFKDPGKIGLGKNGLDYSNAGYMDVHDNKFDGMDFWGPLIVGGLAGFGAWAGAGAEAGAEAGLGATATENAIDAEALGGANTGASGAAGAEAGTSGAGLDATATENAIDSGSIGSGGSSGGGTTWNPNLSVSENLGIPQASYAQPPGSTPIMGTLADGTSGVTGYQLANGTIQAVDSAALANGAVADLVSKGAVPWYEQLANKITENPKSAETLAKALGSFAMTPTTPTGASGTPSLGNSLSGGGGSSGGGSSGSGVAASSSVTPQQLGLPQFTKFDSPMGVQYQGLGNVLPMANALMRYQQ